MTEQAGQDPQHTRLLDEMEGMLREQLELKPADLKLRLRLASLLSELGRRDAFVMEAQVIHKLLKHDPQHPALKQIAQFAERIKADPALFSEQTNKGPQRRLGEDPQAKAYFAKLQGRYEELKDLNALLATHDRNLIRNFNRPTPLMHARRYSEHNGGAQIAIKREDMSGPGSKLVMSVAGQVLLARELGYKTVVTGSRYSRTGVIMSALANRMGMDAAVFMDEAAAQQNSSYVLHIRCMGARLDISRRKTDTREAAMDFCLKAPDERFLIMGVEAAPAPFPAINQMFVSTLGRETLVQAKAVFKTTPHLMVTRGEHTADAIGWLDPFLSIPGVRLVCVEAQDHLEIRPPSADPFNISNVQLSDEQLYKAEAILEGSEYPSVRREHSTYKDSGRVEYVDGSTLDARAAIKGLARFEGLVCPIRTAYAIGWAARAAKAMPKTELVIVNMVEPYDKDLRTVAQALGASD